MTKLLKKIAHPLNVDKINILLEEHIQNFSFPLDLLTEKLKTLYQLKELSLNRLNATYKSQDTLTEGLNKELLILSFCDPITISKCYVALPFISAQVLMQIFENKENNEAVIQDEFIVKEYCKYFSTLLLQLIKSLDLFENLSLELNTSALPKKDCYTVDLQIKSKEYNCDLRLIFETPFLREMQSKIKRQKGLFDLVDDLADVPLYLSTVLDSTQLSKNEINDLEPGDVIFINTQFKPKENKGTFTLILENCPLAIARYKEGKIKILDIIKTS